MGQYRRLGVAWVAVAIVGCAETSSGTGDTGPGATTPATSAELADLCEAQCTRSTKCSDTLPEADAGAIGCEQSCVEDYGAIGDNLRGDIARATADCLRNLPCGEIDDQCTSRALEAVGEDVAQVVNSPDVQKCLTKQAECKDMPGHFSDDLCGVLPILVSSKRAAMARCLDDSCDALGACLAPIVGP